MTTRIYMESTRVASERTLSLINKVLLEMGATHILQDCKDGQIVGLSFVIPSGGQNVPYRLPARFDAVWRVINGRRSVRTRERYADQDRDQAIRVAWRQLYRWIEAQLAMIQTGMVAADEVMMPYMRLKGNRTLYELATAEGTQRLLPLLDKEPINRG